MPAHAASASAPLVLEQFLPYRLSVLSNRVSRAVARLYENQFDLKLPEWRVMAVLGPAPHLTASEITDITAMDKVAISRALKRLIAMGRITASGDPDDARRQRLELSSAGQTLYQQIVPLAKSVEAQLLDVISNADRPVLNRLIDQLNIAAGRLEKTGI